MLNAGLRGRVWLICITSFLKADGGYTFIYSHRPGEMTRKAIMFLTTGHPVIVCTCL